MYRDYPDYDIDAVAEQRALTMAELVVLQFPMRWYSVPPLLKLWQDEVLERGWAYGPGGTALRGKQMRVVATTGGTALSFSEAGAHRRDVEEFLLPLEHTAALCGMDWLAPIVLHDAHNQDSTALDQHIAQVSAALTPAAAQGDSA